MKHQMRQAKIAAAVVLSLSAAMAFAGVPKDLPIPQGSPSADQIIEQVYYVNHLLLRALIGIECDQIVTGFGSFRSWQALQVID